MKNKLLHLFIFLFSISALKAQNSNKSGWKADVSNPKSFIENKGQFSNTEAGTDVKFAMDHGKTLIYFKPSGIVFHFKKNSKGKRAEEERERLMEGAAATLNHEELEDRSMDLEQDFVSMTFENANPNAQIVASAPTQDYFNYPFASSNQNYEQLSFIQAYKVLTYKNIYPNIDVEYVFHETDGIKYNIIVRPGGDASLIRMKYEDTKSISLSKGNVEIDTKFGDIIDHAPVTYYQGNTTNTIVSKFVRDGKTISFDLNNYDHSKTIVIDPWVQTPAGLSNANCVWECERDGAGNVYIIGGDMPLKLIKYNATGTLQWTLSTPYDSTSWLGVMATDLAGNTYVTQGSAAKIAKVNTAGVLQYNVTGGGLDEYWSISFNCDQTKLIVGGTKGTFGFPTPSLEAAIFDINPANGSVTATQVVATGNATAFPPTVQEVRAISSSKNAKYYFLTLDTIGYLNQNITGCNGTGSLYKTTNSYSLSYKCENWRFDNTGICAIKANKNFVYTQNGTNVHKRSLSNFAILATAAIPGGASTTSLGQKVVGNSGIDLDSCGNVYVGSSNGVYKFDANLNPITSAATTFKVYDVAVSTGGNVIVAGSTGTSANTSGRVGSVQSFSLSACDPIVLTCCDASICQVPNKCTTDAAFNLSVNQSGGTFSGTGITNASTGTFNPSVSGAGTFWVYYTLPCGKDSTQITVNTCATLTVCQNTNGTVTVSNGTPTYTWQNQTTTQDCSGCVVGCNFPPGCAVNVTSWVTFGTGTTVTPPSFPIRVTDGSSNTITIASLASLPACSSCPTITVTPAANTPTSCPGVSDGSFSASSSGGASPYDYILLNSSGTTVATFSNVAGSQSFTGLAAGTYTINVTDNSNCTGTTTVTITSPAAIVPSISSQTNASCGLSNGSATASATGGSGAYTYSWAPTGGTGGNTATYSGLAAGVYTVTVTSGVCTSTTTVTITSGSSFTATTSSTQATCGTNNGTVTATPSGGSAPYTYSWNSTPVQTTQTATGLAAGTYTCIITDNATCTTTVTATITSSSGLTGTTSVTAATCGGTNGTATANPTGGTSPYTYSWSTTPIQTTQTATGLAAGTYTVTITDNATCTTTATATITSSSSLSGTTSVTAATCGANNGTATANPTGGTSPYTYSWSTTPAQTTQTATGLAAGTYTVTITDNATCTTTAIATITATSGFTATASSTQASCGSNNGTATATPTGGTAPYTYSWNTVPVQTTQTGTGLAAGTYSVSILDASSCLVTATVTVTSSSGLSGTTSVTASTCGSNNGTATATPTGGTGPYTYSWNTTPIQTTQTATGLGAGTYTVTITDASSCSATATATITSSSSLSGNTSVVGSTCGSANGSATATPTGGTGPYTYSWNTTPVQTTQTATNLAAGTYTVTITDAGSCTTTATATITTTSSLTVTTSGTTIVCSGGSTTLTANAAGATSYSWSTTPVQTGATITVSPTTSTTYTVVALNGGCTGTSTVTVTVGSAPSTIITGDTTICLGQTTTLTAGAGGTYLWSPGGQTTQSINVNPTTNNTVYSVTLTNSNPAGCNTATASVSVDVGGLSSVNAGANQTINIGQTATLTATNASNFTWNTGATSATINVTPTQTTTYTVTSTDASGCVTSDVVLVTVDIKCGEVFMPTAFSPNGDGNNDVECVYGNCISSVYLAIYDRWGEKVFETEDKTICWDGTYKGKPLNTGVYVYKLEATLFTNEVIQKKGNITLTR